MLERGYVRMAITDLETSIRIGIHSWERQGPQRIRINVEMFADDSGGAPAEGLSSVINYDHVREAIATWPGRPHTELLETLLEELIDLCFRDLRVRACRVSIVKPDIFPEAASAGVEIFRLRD